ncbi:MAG: hypothetical protein OXT69_13745 [Candidatus Poribacteria bacterium]|nr:hypothetical protein [Candidatus Poribacteria bacterium]
MPIYRLEKTDGDLSKAELIVAQETDLQLEEHLESWLENSPGALIPDEIVLWIGRQTSARTEENVVFPDLLGVDADGNLIVAELKRAKTPRDTVAQLLEYAAWANELTEEQIHAHAEGYLEKPFQNAFREAFDIPDDEDIPPLNSAMRLFIAAGEILPSVAAVCRFLRTTYGMDVSCLSVSTFQTEAGEMLVGIESTVGDETSTPAKKQKRSESPSGRWSRDKPVKEVVREAAHEFTGGDTEMEFTPKELFEIIIKKYPEFNRATVLGQITPGCPNHPSQKHHSGKHKSYWRVGVGKYRLYDPDRDGADEAEAS